MTVSSALESVCQDLISQGEISCQLCITNLNPGIPFGGYANAFKTTTTQWLNSTIESCSDVIQEGEDLLFEDSEIL